MEEEKLLEEELRREEEGGGGEEEEEEEGGGGKCDMLKLEIKRQKKIMEEQVRETMHLHSSWVKKRDAALLEAHLESDLMLLILRSHVQELADEKLKQKEITSKVIADHLQEISTLKQSKVEIKTACEIEKRELRVGTLQRDKEKRDLRAQVTQLQDEKRNLKKENGRLRRDHGRLKKEVRNMVSIFSPFPVDRGVIFTCRNILITTAVFSIACETVSNGLLQLPLIPSPSPSLYIAFTPDFIRPLASFLSICGSLMNLLVVVFSEPRNLVCLFETFLAVIRLLGSSITMYYALKGNGVPRALLYLTLINSGIQSVTTVLRGKLKDMQLNAQVLELMEINNAARESQGS